jgi:PAS domain S-box-containing protein
MTVPLHAETSPPVHAVSPVTATAPPATTEVGDPRSSRADAVAASPPLGEMLELILAATNDGIMDWDLVKGTVHYSERWKTLLGFEDHELANTLALWQDLSHPEDLPGAEALLRDHVENLWPFAHRWRMRHKNGGWRWSLCRAVTLHDDRGVPLRCVGIFTDVTDQVLSEQRLSELTRRNELLLTSAGEGFLGIDVSGTITFANPAAGQVLGYSVADLVGKKFPLMFTHGCPPERPCVPACCPILKPFTDGGVHRQANGTFGRGDGSSCAVDYVCTPAREEQVVIGVVLTFRDVTEQRRIEAHLMQGQKLEAIGQLAAGIAHEINTPMQYIGDNVAFLGDSFAELLKLIGEYRSVIDAVKNDPGNAPLVGELADRTTTAEDLADLGFLADNVPKAISATTEGIGRVRKIVYAMKEFSHPGQAEKSLADLNHAIDGTLTISANIWKQVATLDMNLDPQLPAVSCHLGEINQVILNLVVNASHAIADARKDPATDPLGVIRIETAVKDGFAEIRISDTGGGIPEHVRHRIFEPFFTTKEVGRGTGQGLTLAHSMVVDKHAGFLRFTTETGKGTTFIVGLPLTPPA